MTYNNPDYEKKKRMGFWAYGVSKEIKLWNEYNGSLYVPIGFFNTLYKYHPINTDYVDYSVSKPIKIKSDIKLRDYQENTINIDFLTILPITLFIFARMDFVSNLLAYFLFTKA